MAYTTESFVKKAKEVHGDKYDYSKVEYKDSESPVTIICKKHGEFRCIPSEHLGGKGCIKCKREEDFIKRAKERFGDKYDYSKVIYNGCNEKVTIICPEHGEFKQSPSTHLSTHVGCPECGKISAADGWHKVSVGKFIENARKKHGNKYDYSKVQYNGIYDRITVICPEHGEFYPTAFSHIHKYMYGGCPECGKENHAKGMERWSQERKKQALENFIKEAKEKCGDKYDYSKVVYKGKNYVVDIICPEHGIIHCSPSMFLKNGGCPLCKKQEEFISAAKKIHGDKFDYSKVKYKDSYTRVCIIDKKHGEFWQTPHAHLRGGEYNGITTKEQVAPINQEKWTYEVCKKMAEGCTYFQEFYRKCPGAYNKSKSKGWTDDFTWLKNYTSKSDRVIYVYELPDNHAYVGLTMNIEQRDAQHRGVDKYFGRKGDSLYEYCKSANIEMPKPKILEEGLSRQDAGNAERKWIKKYRKDGWRLINKNDGGSTGSLPRLMLTEEEIIDVCKNYKNMEELYNKNRTIYNLMNRLGIKKKCFPDATFVENMAKPRNYTEEYILENVGKYDYVTDLRKSDPTLFHWLYNHGRLYEFYEAPAMGPRKTGPRKKM